MSRAAAADTTATEVLQPHPVCSIIHTDIAALAEIEGLGGREWWKGGVGGWRGAREGGVFPPNMHVWPVAASSLFTLIFPLSSSLLLFFPTLFFFFPLFCFFPVNFLSRTGGSSPLDPRLRKVPHLVALNPPTSPPQRLHHPIHSSFTPPPTPPPPPPQGDRPTAAISPYLTHLLAHPCIRSVISPLLRFDNAADECERPPPVMEIHGLLWWMACFCERRAGAASLETKTDRGTEGAGRLVPVTWVRPVAAEALTTSSQSGLDFHI